jgi:putative transposase
MRAPYTQLYLHLVWATWNRWPLITPKIRAAVYAGIKGQANRVGVDLIALGGMEDHVHALVRFPTTVTVADLVRHLKGATSHMVAHEIRPGEAFRWQGGYGAFTVSKPGVPRARDYVLNQESHHALGTLHPDLEATNEP